MSIERLIRIAPPIEPIELGNEPEWLRVEKSMGIELPDDYKDLVNTYGSGCFGQYLYVLNPFALAGFAKRRDLVTASKRIVDRYRNSQQTAPEGHPKYPAYPAAGGLLPWAIDENNGVLTWLTDGNPEDWPIVSLDDVYSDLTSEYRMSSTDFISDWLSSEFGAMDMATPRADGAGRLFVPYNPSIHH